MKLKSETEEKSFAAKIRIRCVSSTEQEEVSCLSDRTQDTKCETNC